MAGPYHSVDAIIQNLKDAGCDQAITQIFLDNLCSGERANAIRLLEKHRCTLLDILHTAQKRIDCLDYLLFTLQKHQKQKG